jgi:hypothetical protein
MMATLNERIRCLCHRASVVGVLVALAMPAITSPAAAPLIDPSPDERGARIKTVKQGGCWLEGKWFPEGARVYPSERSRIAVRGYSLCTNGKWVFIVTK